MYLYIPIEVKNRELHAKLLLADKAAFSGFRVILGDQRQIVANVHKFPSGIYLDKSCAKTKRNFFRRLKLMGHHVVSTCEEGLAYRDTDRYLAERFDSVAFDALSAFFCWGSNHQRDVATTGVDMTKVYSVGNPRIDILHHRYDHVWSREIDEIVTSLQPYILVNTNFGRIDNFSNLDVIEILRRRGTLGDGDRALDYYTALKEHLTEVRRDFIHIVKEISSRNHGLNVVIRPHPSENFSVYETHFAHSDNVVIDRSGSAIPWMRGAMAVLQSSCTTGVEARLSGVLCFNYLPKGLTKFDNAITAESTECVHSVSEAVDVLLNSGRHKHKSDQQSLRDLQAWIHPGFRSCDLILNVISKLPPSTVTTAAYLFRLQYAAIQAVRILNRLLRLRKNQKSKDYKFDGLSVGEIEAIVEKLRTNGTRPPRIKKLWWAEGCYEVSYER